MPDWSHHCFERQRPVFDPELVHQIVEIVANRPVVAGVEIDAGEVVAQIISAALRELAEHVGCQVQTEIPGTVPLGGEMRLVGENRRHIGPEFAELPLVRFMR